MITITALHLVFFPQAAAHGARRHMQGGSVSHVHISCSVKQTANVSAVPWRRKLGLTNHIILVRENN